MSQLYARVFVQILDSSISEDFTCRHVFEDLLKLCDYRSGIVDVTREALSRRLNIPLPILEKAINKLESPDSKSRDQDFEGRRIIRLDDHRNWGWRIANWEKYEKIKRRVDGAIRVAKHRASKPPAKEPHQSAEEIYQAYPLKVAKQKAIQAITKQLSSISPEILLAATKQFAKTWESSPDKTFCPHPTTWFNQQRFNDSPETWKPNHGNTPGQKPTSIMDLKLSLQIKEQKAHVLKAKNTFEDAMGTKWNDPEAKADYLKLRNEIKGLQARIEEMV